ncbi:MAG: carboxymuconolactone decarboxylase family protein, partial [Alphaproteobacteria bacterium]|nr:carboxymuconolactone decarboxylase family protein [Alphaproteobacteria bacterium]
FDAIAGSRGHVVGPFLGLLHSPELADRVQNLGAFLRYRTRLGPRLSELAILLTSRAFSCQFEWYAHEKHAREAGVSDAIIEAVRAGRRPAGMQDDEAAVHDYAKELLETRGVSDATHARAREAFGVPAVVELTGLVGYYSLLAMTLNAHRIGPPDGAEPLPPVA